MQDAQARVTTLALNQANAQSVRAAREAAETRLKEASAALIDAKAAMDDAIVETADEILAEFFGD